MSKSKFDLNKCKIIKELGQGMVGQTHLVELDCIKYALKIEKIPELNASEKFDTKYPEWREIEFSQEFGNKYPDQFIKLYAWDIIDNCDYVNPSDFSYLPEEVQKRLQEKIDSKLCIRKLYSLVDTSLSKIIKTLDKKQLYSLIIQTANIIWLLGTEGYSHNDLHGQNIGVVFTDKKYINVLKNNIPIPTYGCIFTALDFGNITKKTWKLTEYEKKFKSKDTIRILTKLVKYENKFDVGSIQINKLLGIKEVGTVLMDKIKETVEWDDLNQYIIDLNPDDKLILFQILYTEIFQQILLGDKFEKINKLIYLIDIEDIIYFMKNKSNLKKIIKYFVCKIYDIEIDELE